MTGGELADLVATPNPVTTDMLTRGYDAEEITYPYGVDSRYRREDPVPWVLISTLGRMTDEPDGLFDELVEFARGLAPAPAADQYRGIFAWLTARMERTLWVERSGSSIDYLGDLARLFPDARFVHIHRDGREAALSIRAHPFYRLAVSLLYDGLVPEIGQDEDPVVALVESVPDVEWFGRYWTDQLVNGFAAVPQLDRDQYLDVRFEDLVARPANVLGEVAAFLELPADEGFVQRAAALVKGVPPTRFEALSEGEQERLRAACDPGMRLLRRTE
jgi:hypothetical protein